MRLTPEPRNKIRPFRFTIVTAVAAVMFLVHVGVAQGAFAWSHPKMLAEGVRQYGYQGAQVGDSLVVIATVQPLGEKTIVQVREFTPDNNSVNDGLKVEASDLVQYQLIANSTGYALVWLERTTTSSRLSLVSPGQSALVIKTTHAYVDSFSATMDDSGRVMVSYTHDANGLQAVYLHARDSLGEVLIEELEVSRASQPCVEPRALVSGDWLHIVYKAKDHIFTNVTHQVMSLTTKDITLPLNIRTTATPDAKTPVLLPAGQGGVRLYWNTEAPLRGQARGSKIMGATIRHDGAWHETPRELMQSDGSSYAPAVASTPEGQYLIAFSNNRSGSFQVYVWREGSLIVATYGAKHCFDPQVFVINAQLYVTYFQIREDSAEVFLTKYTEGGRLPWAVRLGLDPEAPLLDSLFKLFTLVTTASTLMLLAFGSIILAALLLTMLYRYSGVGKWPRGGLGSHALMCAILALLKRYAGYLYYGAVFVPGISGLLINLGSILFALCVVKLYSLERHDMFSWCISGSLWVFADAFCSVYVKGVGLW